MVFFRAVLSRYKYAEYSTPCRLHVNGYQPDVMLQDAINFFEKIASKLPWATLIKNNFQTQSISQIPDNTDSSRNFNWCTAQNIKADSRGLYLFSTPNLIKNIMMNYGVSMNLAYTQKMICALIQNFKQDQNNTKIFSSHSTGAITHALALSDIYNQDPNSLEGLKEIHFVNPNLPLHTLLKVLDPLSKISDIIKSKIKVYYIPNDPVLEFAKLHSVILNKKRKNRPTSSKISRLNTPFGLGPEALRGLPATIIEKIHSTFEFIAVLDSNHQNCPDNLYSSQNL